MRKALHSRLLSSKKIIGRVLRKPSSHKDKRIQMSEETTSLSKEIDALKDQIENLKAAVNTLQTDADKKDIALAKLVKEKEKVTCDLLKQRRVNGNLTKQLEDERNFYFKEKQIYCHEMNEYKKLKASISTSNVREDNKKSVSDYVAEIVNLKRTLSQTLTTNYNLSIKFLRMKNTKSFLKHELERVQVEHEKVVNDLKTRLGTITSEMNDVLELKVDACISPSNKKYLQVVKQNSSLMYEHLCLQLEVDRLNLKVDKLKLYKTKSETNSRMRYLRNEYCPEKVDKHCDKHGHGESKKVRLDVPARSKKQDPNQAQQEEKVIKIFERLESPGVPLIDVLDDNKAREKRKKSKEHGKSHTELRKSHKEHRKSHRKREEKSDKDANNVVTSQEKCVTVDASDPKLAVLTVAESQTSSELKTYTSSVISAGVVETQSAPDIVQSSPTEKHYDNTYEEVTLVNNI